MRLSLNKNSLKQQRDNLKMYRRFLPSLDLKRQQLLAALKASRVQLAEVEQEIEKCMVSLDKILPLLGSSTLGTRDLSQLVRVKEVLIEEENVVGARVPMVRKIEFERANYSTLALPFWIDQLVDTLEHMARLRVQLQIQKLRVDRLNTAARKITQRVNLFEKVLIPTAEDNIKRIRIALSDEERSAVVRSKLAKRKQR
ncbi:MAG: V-type ATP synthase subunit D [Gemmataceae bacterium]